MTTKTRKPTPRPVTRKTVAGRKPKPQTLEKQAKKLTSKITDVLKPVELENALFMQGLLK